MNREILFKAKRLDNGEWVEGLLTVMWGQYHIINPSDENTAYPIDTNTLCQYTGLTDKNGKKIWDNDILKHYYKSDEPELFIRGVIYWNKDRLRYERTSFESKDQIYMVSCDCEYEVIGNIFDNPELVGGGNEYAIQFCK